MNESDLSGDELAGRLAAIVDSADDAIVSKTLAGVITSWNAGAESMFGYSSAEAVGQPITLIIPEARRWDEDHVLALIRKGERVDHCETERVAKDGRLLEISLTVSRITNSAGQVIGASKIARDIIQHRRLGRERDALLAREQKARGEAETLNRIKDEFLATLSHELRTPLNAILGWARLLQAGRLDAQTARRATEAIVRNSMAQVRLVDDLLDVSRIITGHMRLEVRPVDVKMVVEAALDAVRPAADAKAIWSARPLPGRGTRELSARPRRQLDLGRADDEKWQIRTADRQGPGWPGRARRPGRSGRLDDLQGATEATG